MLWFLQVCCLASCSIAAATLTFPTVVYPSAPGYTSSEFFARWAPELGFTPKALQAVLPDKHCGYCNGASGRTGRATDRDRPHLYAVNPAEAPSSDNLCRPCHTGVLRNYWHMLMRRDRASHVSSPWDSAYLHLAFSLSDYVQTATLPIKQHQDCPLGALTPVWKWCA